MFVVLFLFLIVIDLIIDQELKNLKMQENKKDGDKEDKGREILMMLKHEEARW